MMRAVLGAACACSLAGCDSAPVRPDAGAAARPSSSAPAPLPLVSEADALGRVARLPEVRELGQQDWTPAHPDGLGRKVKPMVKCIESVEKTCRERCVYTIDVIDASEEGTSNPAFRFYLDAKTNELSIEASEPFPKGPMAYEAYRKLMDEQRLVVDRLFALPEMRQVQARLAREKPRPPCQKSRLTFLPTSAPGLDCKRGSGCAWVFEARTPNGCVASLLATFEVDSPDGAIRVSDSVTGFTPVPLPEWRDKHDSRR